MTDYKQDKNYKLYLEDDKKHPDSINILNINGYECMIRKSIYSGTWNGYVFIPSNHKLFKKHYNYLAHLSPEITFSNFINNKWCIGFDHAHWADYQPKMVEQLYGTEYEKLLQPSPYGTLQYFTFEDVRKELESLIKQINQ